MVKRKLPPRGQVRIRSSAGGNGYIVTIPAGIGRLVGLERLFEVELVDEGILLRYVEGGEPLRGLPDWLLHREEGKA